MRIKIIVIALLGCLFCGFSSSPRVSDWSRYYESQYKQPYGTYVFHKELEASFPDALFQNINSKTPDFLIEEYIEHGTYFYINRTLRYMDSAIQAELLDFMMYDNGIFVASTNFNRVFFETYDIQTSYFYAKEPCKLTLTKPNGVDNFEIENIETQVFYFSNLPDNVRVLGTIEVNGEQKPNFISYSFGGTNAQILLHCNPELFTNYHMLNKKDGTYALSTLRHLVHTDELIWDGKNTRKRFYRQEQQGGTTGLLRFIMANKSLRYGFFTLVSCVILLLIFNYKRVTRELKIYKPQENNSVAFIKTIATLFMNQKNHVDLAKYRVNFILDRIRNKHHLDTTELNDNFKKQFASKVGVHSNNVEVFVSTLHKTRSARYLSREEFIAFNTIIERNIKKLKIYE